MYFVIYAYVYSYTYSVRVKIRHYKTDHIMHILSSLYVYARVLVCLLNLSNIFKIFPNNISCDLFVTIWVSLDLIFNDFLCNWPYSKNTQFLLSTLLSILALFDSCSVHLSSFISVLVLGYFRRKNPGLWSFKLNCYKQILQLNISLNRQLSP